MAQGYLFHLIEQPSGTMACVVESDTFKTPISLFDKTYPKSVFSNVALFSRAPDGSGISHLSQRHQDLIFGCHPLKRRITDESRKPTDKFYKVEITPLIMFTDVTSGNISKQYNLFDSWSMVCGALPLEERNKRSNTHFIGAVPGKDGLSALHMVSALSEDIKKLEQGVVMYSSRHNEHVLVVTPLVFITADDPRHSQLCCIYGLTSSYPCRMCYQKNYRSTKTIRTVPQLKEIMDCDKPRTKAHYLEASRNLDGVVEGVLDNAVTYDHLRFKATGAEKLLDLESFDPSFDTPVEILHTILLSIAEYLVVHLVKDVIRTNDKHLKRVELRLQQYQGSAGFTRKLTHCGSFLGRDFKILKQCLPVVLSYKFTGAGDTAVLEVGKLFTKLGMLSSLVFVSEVPDNLDKYVDEVKNAMDELTRALHHYDTNNTEYSPLSTKPKMHLLQHLPDHIMRFGYALMS
ncbi:unnamed protein product [Absidia cylindrospora]